MEVKWVTRTTAQVLYETILTRFQPELSSPAVMFV